MAPPARATITVEEWLARSRALLARDRIQAESADDPEMQALFVQEVVPTFRKLRAEFEADVSAGRKPFACLPPLGDPRANIDSRQVLDWLRAVPTADRGETVEQAMVAYVRNTFPCPAAADSAGNPNHE